MSRRAMSRRPLARAAALSAGLVLVLAGTAAADSALGDADLATPGFQGTRDLGTVAPGATVAVDVGFTVTCTGYSHVDRGQTVTFGEVTSTVPPGGGLVVGAGTVGPVSAAWPADGDACPDPAPALDAGTPSHVTLTAPTAEGTYKVSILYGRTLAPAGLGDAGALPVYVGVDLEFTVAAAPPDPAPAPDPAPPPAPAPEAMPSVAFLAPLAGDDVVVPRWVRTLPVRFRLDPDAPAATAPPTLALVPLAACDATAAAGPERDVAVRSLGKSGTWMGQADLRAIGVPCARLEVRIEGVVAGSARIVLRP